MRASTSALLALATASLGCSAPATSSSPPPREPAECADDGWEWVRHPDLVVGGDRAIGGVVAYGARGAFSRWESDRWVSMPIPTRCTIVSGWSASPRDAWASDAAGDAWHFDGATWTVAPADARIDRVIASPDASAAWAMAGGGDAGHGVVSGARLLRRDGDAWVEPFEPYPYCLGGDYLVRRDGEVWSTGLACDAAGAVAALEVRRFDGASWELVGAPIEGVGWYPHFERLADDRVAVVATTRFDWDGSAWQPAEAPLYPQDLAPDEAASWDELGFTRHPRALECDDVYRVDDAHAWCFGHGRVFFGDGASWSATIEDPFDATGDADAWGTIPPTVWAGSDAALAWGTGPTDVYRVRESAGGALEHFDGAAWSVVLDGPVDDLDGAPDSELWVVAGGDVLRGDARGLAPVALPDGVTLPTRVEVLDDGTVLVATFDVLLRFERGGWARLHDAPHGTWITDVAGTSSTDVWITQTPIRSIEVDVLRSSGDGFVAVDVPGASSFGTLFTTGGATWLVSRGMVARLGERAERIDAWHADRSTSLWSDGSTPWLTSAWQALRRPVP